jgi:hypothetical protein
VNHVGVYMGEGMFAHASRTRGVVYESMRFFPGEYRGARSIFTASALRTTITERPRLSARGGNRSSRTRTRAE